AVRSLDPHEYPEKITPENREFIKEVTYEKFGPPAVLSGISTYQTSSPLREKPLEKGEWTPKSRRCGLITRKIGQYPMWSNTGKIIWTTLLQVVDNHVVKYTPPELVDSPRKPSRFLRPNKFGCILVGAESCDPQKFTREYCGLFAPAGLPPKRVLGRFFVTPEAAIQPGTPLSALHFQPGDTVDVIGKTIDRGFQGVMKRWGFKGQRGSHGSTKTHRRPGNVGGGGKRAGIWPGTKMPGHMGNRTRFLRGLKIWRINTKYNILYVQGLGVPGATNSVVYVHDTILPLRKRKDVSKPPPFPTHDPSSEEDLQDDLFDSFNFLVNPASANSFVVDGRHCIWSSNLRMKDIGWALNDLSSQCRKSNQPIRHGPLGSETTPIRPAKSFIGDASSRECCSATGKYNAT
ncbi:hypothetical protein GE061_009544, partial [Apolygus lucorum]